MTDETTNAPDDGPVIEPPYEGSSALSISELPRDVDRGAVPEPEAAPEPDAAPAEPASEAESKPDGYQQVDFQSDSREAIEARFHRLYGQMKRQSQMMDQMVTDNRSLHEKLSNFEVGQVQNNVAQQMNALQSQLQEAMDIGDSQRTTALVRQISQLETQSANWGAQIQAAQQQAAQQEAAPQAGQQEHPDVAVIRNWSADRPWSQEGHEHRSWAAFQLNELYQNPEWANRSVGDKLAEVDRMYQQNMAPKAGNSASSQPKQAQVLVENTSQRRTSSATNKLTDAQKAVAVRMFPEASRDEAYSLYAQGMR